MRKEDIPFQIHSPDGTIIDWGVFLGLGLTPRDIRKIYVRMKLSRAFQKAAEEGTKTVTAEENGKIVVKRKRWIPLYISNEGQETAEHASRFAARKYFPEVLCIDSAYARSQGGALEAGVLPKDLFDVFGFNSNPQAVKNFIKHLSTLPHALVGCNAPQAAGLALAQLLAEGMQFNKEGKRAVVFCYVGDGATATCDFHSALNFGAVYKIPLNIIVENNQFAISTPNRLEAGTKTFAERALGYGLPFIRVDGNDAFVMLAATRWALEQALNADPATPKTVVIEAVTYRLAPHTTRVGAVKPRPPEEVEEAKRKDPLRRYETFMSSDQAQSLGINWSAEKERKLVNRLTRYIQLRAERTYKELQQAIEEKRGPLLIKKGVELAKKPRINKLYMPESSIVGPEIIRNVNGRKALGFAMEDLANANTHTARVVALGQDVGEIGGVHRVYTIPGDFVRLVLPEYAEKIITRNLPLIERFGKRRFIDTPLDEYGIVGVAVGLAMASSFLGIHLRVVVEIQFSGFVTLAYHQIVSELARLMHRYAGLIDLPVVIRLPYGGGWHIEHHRECEIPFFLNVPGLVIVCPAAHTNSKGEYEVQDLYDMFRSAVELSNKPVLLFEHKTFYENEPSGTLVRRHPTQPVETFTPNIVRVGEDVTVATCGKLVQSAIEAAEMVAKEGISTEIVNMRLISPPDYKTLRRSAAKTGRLVAVQEEPIHGGTGAER